MRDWRYAVQRWSTKKGRRKLTLTHIFNLTCGLLVVGAGVHTIGTKRSSYSSDDGEEETWRYGWRAVAIGVTEVLAGLAFAASGIGVAFLDGL